MPPVPRKPATKAQINKAAQNLAASMLDSEMQIRAAGEMGLGVPCISAGLPMGVGMSMLDAQRFRSNFYKAKPSTLFALARLMAERNWFIRPVLDFRQAVYGAGFTFANPETREWAKTSGYDFKAVHKDLLIECLRSDSVVALWRKNPGTNTRPRIEVPSLTDVESLTGIGNDGIRLRIKRDAKIPENARERMGDKMYEAIKLGKPLDILEGDDFWDYKVLKSGKSNEAFPVPSMTTIFDDLDFIEAVKVADWNGAWVRREIIRHTKKGYSTTSGANAGRTTNNAKKPDLDSILTQMRTVQGKYEMATNFDQNVEWITFAKEFFGADIIDNSLMRLLHWGGLAAVLMLRTESQISGVSTPMLMRLRTEAEAFRSDFSPFLTSIFAAESFRSAFGDMPEDMTPQWCVKPLYSTKELSEYLTIALKGYISPQTIRESFLGVDNELESDRMLEAAEYRDRYMPPYEANQNLVAARNPDDFPGSLKSTASSNGDSAAGPGAPSNAI